MRNFKALPRLTHAVILDSLFGNWSIERGVVMQGEQGGTNEPRKY